MYGISPPIKGADDHIIIKAHTRPSATLEQGLHNQELREVESGDRTNA